MNTKSTQGFSLEQLENGTPSDKRLILRSFYKGDKAIIQPTKDFNQRYLGIRENLSEIQKQSIAYLPTIETRMKIYDEMEINLNDPVQKADWEWMKHSRLIASDYETGQSDPEAFFYVFRPGFESAKAVSSTRDRVKLMNYILNDTQENLYNRATILGLGMDDVVVTDLQEHLLAMVTTEPGKIRQVYESKTFSLELLSMEALKKGVITNKGGVYVFGDQLLGGSRPDIVSFFANSNNRAITRAIEALTYGKVMKSKNPLANEASEGADLDIDDDSPLGQGAADVDQGKGDLIDQGNLADFVAGDIENDDDFEEEEPEIPNGDLRSDFKADGTPKSPQKKAADRKKLQQLK